MINQKAIFKHSGPWLIEKLRAAGYTNFKAAKELEIHFQQVSNWGRGLAKVPPKHINQLAEMISTSSDEVVLNKETLINKVLMDEAERIGTYTKRPLQEKMPELFSSGSPAIN